MLNGTRLRYTGKRTKEGLVGWLEKKINSFTGEIFSPEELEALSSK